MLNITQEKLQNGFDQLEGHICLQCFTKHVDETIEYM